MVDNPENLKTICLRRFSLVLESDQVAWKREIEEKVENVFHKTNSQPLEYTHTRKRSSFLEYFHRGHCSLNSMLSERLMAYLVGNDQLNDYTLSLFSSSVTCLRRVVIHLKYVSRLQCHILHQHPTIVQLEVICKDSNPHRTKELFYQRICPSIYSTFDEIYTVYSPFVLQRRHSRRTSVASTTHHTQRLSTSSDEFSQQKILTGILNSLHPIVIERLKSLSLSHCKFFTSPQSTPARKYTLTDMAPSLRSSTTTSSAMTTPANVIPTNLRLLLKFTKLTSLNLSASDLKTSCLDIIFNALPNLEMLDISSCRSIKSFTALLKLSSKLRWLNLYNCRLRLQENPTIYPILAQLKHLEYLDISNDHAIGEHNHPLVNPESDINRFLSDAHCLPRLKHLDLSGLQTVSSVSLYRFLLNHPDLQFLGLFLTNEKYSQCLFDPHDPCYSKYRRYTYDIEHIVSGTLTEDDLLLYEPYLIEALKLYRDRVGFVQKILYSLFFLTRSFHSKQQHLLVELILRIMSNHMNAQAVQMASTACIYNFTRTANPEQIHVKYLAQIVEATMAVMEAFPNQAQLQKNCLLTLCSDRILHEPYFKFDSLAKLVMHNLHVYTDLAIIQSGVAILSLLTTRLTIDECTRLGSVKNMQRLLQLVEQQIDHLQTVQITQHLQQNAPHNDQSINDMDVQLNNNQQLTSDDTLRFCLSLLWNLTDENAVVCENFIESMGMELFERLLHLFASDTIVLTKIIGLLSNIAEVPHLKKCLHSISVVALMRKYADEGVLDVAFSAMGILAHLLYDQKNDEVDWELCERASEAIKTWHNPHANMVTYRSFKPFLPLLYCTRIPVVQLWAIWAIHHVCSTDRRRYTRIIREEKIYEIIETLYDDQISSAFPDAFLTQLLRSILHLLRSFDSSSSAVAS